MLIAEHPNRAQSHPSRAPLSAHSRAAAPLEGSLGVLLLDFFRLYGRSLHTEYVGVSCRCQVLSQFWY